MHCIFCGAQDTKVVDSRLVADGRQVRRRRECLECKERATTYEVVELTMPRVIKQDGSRMPFDENKLRSGMLKALEKRPVKTEKLEVSLQRLLQKVRVLGDREVSSQILGEMVMDALRALDDVAYVRFASVYRSFQDISAFKKEIDLLEQETRDNKNTQVGEISEQ